MSNDTGFLRLIGSDYFDEDAVERPIIDYYWRDYASGKIPQDAVTGGTNFANETTYIGQALYPGYGLFVGPIVPKSYYVTVAYDTEITNSDTAVKILCGSDLSRFKWLKVDGKTLHVDTIGKHLIIGGYENQSILNVGRAMYQGELIIGSRVPCI